MIGRDQRALGISGNISPHGNLLLGLLLNCIGCSAGLATSAQLRTVPFMEQMGNHCSILSGATFWSGKEKIGRYKLPREWGVDFCLALLQRQQEGKKRKHLLSREQQLPLPPQLRCELGTGAIAELPQPHSLWGSHSLCAPLLLLLL